MPLSTETKDRGKPQQLFSDAKILVSFPMHFQVSCGSHFVPYRITKPISLFKFLLVMSLHCPSGLVRALFPSRHFYTHMFVTSRTAMAFL